MRRQLLAEAWQKLQGSEPPEDLPDHPVDMLFELLPAEPIDVVAGFKVGLAESSEDPWRRMIVDRDPEEALKAWVFEAAQLLLVGRGPSDEWLAVDEEDDPKGNNRVYLVSADGKSAQMLFPTIERFVKWVVSSKAPPAPSSDQWSKNPASVEGSLDALWRLHPADLFLCHRMGTWPSETPPLPKVSSDTAGWRRVALLWTLACFTSTKEAHIPEEMLDEELTPVHSDLIDHLAELQAAIVADEVPTLVADLALDDDEEAAHAAMDWMIAFDRAREKREDARDEAASEMAEKTKGALLLLQQALDELIRLEHIEVPQARKSKLVESMLEAVIKAASPYATVPALIETLLDSPYVEEVYADDSELERVLSRALGLAR